MRVCALQQALQVGEDLFQLPDDAASVPRRMPDDAGRARDQQQPCRHEHRALFVAMTRPTQRLVIAEWVETINS